MNRQTNRRWFVYKVRFVQTADCSDAILSWIVNYETGVVIFIPQKIWKIQKKIFTINENNEKNFALTINIENEKYQFKENYFKLGSQK